MTIVKASVRPIIQINTLPGFIDKLTLRDKPADFPEDKMKKIRATMTPNAGSQYIKNEKPNSPTRLLAATLAFKILNKFRAGVTQRRL